MRPLAQFPVAELARLDYLLCDIDDTVTAAGRLPAVSLQAMEQLEQAQVAVIPVTGRPAGWCDHIARMWPVTAVVGENGALWYAYDRATRLMQVEYAKDAVTRAEDRVRLDKLAKRILAAVPGCALASDQFCRIADLAVDFCEDVPALGQREIDRIVEMFSQAGANAKVSSIHVNGWFGKYDKLSMTRRCLASIAKVDIEADNRRCVYIGDSPNDQPMFAHFVHSVGVANVANFKLDNPPRWITGANSAAGFVELAAAVLSARKQNH